MKKRIQLIDGMPVEMPVLDEEGERERARLNELANEEYESYGTLTSDKLQEANTQFMEIAKLHVKKEGDS